MPHRVQANQVVDAVRDFPHMLGVGLAEKRLRRPALFRRRRHHQAAARSGPQASAARLLPEVRVNLFLSYFAATHAGGRVDSVLWASGVENICHASLFEHLQQLQAASRKQE